MLHGRWTEIERKQRAASDIDISICVRTCVSLLFNFSMYTRSILYLCAGDWGGKKSCFILMDLEKSCFPHSSIFFAPQDSDGDKSEDNLVVDVSNEVRRQSF